eukprot:TRINITY_DN2092_c0_g2_i1.p1 TRINITY_DN2092_c0_g2~~TRINITY_DN2092_c0_g2_i1.p1  ORF type:complete len:1763 (-),score=374.29 TRINITY_DN2092_c0_g2_i1:1009-6297(-)
MASSTMRSLLLVSSAVLLLLVLLSTCKAQESNPPMKNLNSRELKKLFPDHPVLMDPVYKTKSGLLLSQSWDIAETHIDVQEELYQHVAIPCFNCSARFFPNNCACDYSDPDNCGKVRKGCPPESCPKNLTDIYCSKDLPKWTQLPTQDVYKSKMHTIKDGEVQYFRLHQDDPCTGFHIRFNYEFGNVETYVATLSSIPGSNNILLPTISNTTWAVSATYPGHTQVTICPAASSYRPGTFVIATVCRKPEAKFSVEIYRAKAVTQRPASVGGGPIYGVTATRNQNLCPNTTLVCLNDTQPYTFTPIPGGEFPRFRYDVTGKKGECTPLITIFVENLVPGTFSFFLVSYTLGINRATALDPTHKGLNVAMIYTPENIYHGQYCFEETGTFGIFVMVEAFVPVPFRITLSTTVPYYERSLLDLSPYQYGYDATNVMIQFCPTLGVIFCDEWLYGCAGMWHVYPSEEETDPFWPPPASWGVKRNSASNTIFQNLIHHDTPLLKRSNDTMTVITVLSNNLFGKAETAMSEEEFSQCSFVSSNTLFNSKGKVLLGRTEPPRKSQPKCDADDIKEVVSIGQSYVSQISESKSFDEVLELTFQVNTLFFSDAWIGCINYTNSFLTSKVEDIEVLTTECFVSNISSPAYLNNPCCNSALLVNQCCYPKPKHEETTVYKKVKSSKIDQVCNAPSCVNSYMLDYLVIEQESLSCSSFSSEEYPMLYTSSVQYYVDCKAKYNIDKLAFGLVNCTSDENCYFGGVKNKCNRATSRCILSSEAEEKAWNCAVDGLDEYREYYFKERFNLTGRKGDSEYRNGLLDAVSHQDCINTQGVAQFTRNGFIYQSSVANCPCKSTKCLDQTCEILPESCQQSCFLQWVPLEISQSTCQSLQKCNWALGSQCTSKDSVCDQGCAPTTLSSGFCAYCDTDAYCIEIPGITTQSDCEAAQACIAPNGKLSLTTEAQCKNVTGCSQQCPGQSCQSANGGDVCIAKIPQSACIASGGVWRTDIISPGVCSFNVLDAKLCAARGAQYYTCSGLSLTDCNTCNSRKGFCPVNQTIAKCYVSPKRDCVSDQECSKKAGRCTDQDFYVSLTTIPPTFGACIRPTATKYYQENPTCTSTVPTSPEGCYSFQNASVCTSTGGVFHSLAMTKDECLGGKGCTSDPQLRSLFVMNARECKKCNRTRESFYDWTPGYPVKAKSVSLQWKQRTAEDVNAWKKTIDWNKFYSTIVDSISAAVLTDIRSGVVCSFNARANLLETITCACMDSNKDTVSSCFTQETSIQTGTGEACIALDTIIQTTTGSVAFSKSSVSKDSNQRCASISVYSSSIYTLEQPEQIAYSPLSRVRDYDSFNIVLNDDNAIVGRMMSDGFEVKTSGADLQFYTLCLRLSSNSGSPPSSFDVWDFGYRDGQFLVAMEVNVRRKFDDLYCGEIRNPETDRDYFLIKRMDNYKDQSGSLYSDGETACWWVFAAAFTVLAVFGVGMIVAHYLGMSLHYYFRFAMLAFSVMATTRAIYFYLLAARVLEDKSASGGTYFLIEFPTVMYVTAFSCICGFWLYLLHSHHKRTVLAAIGLFNVIVYGIFIVLAILFEALPNSEEESQCAGREPAVLDNTNTKIVSIVYQSTMAGISVFLALFISISGSKLFLGLQQKLFERKVALVTLICTLGLLLHCSFILYLSATFTDNFTIIVLMIVLSELVPISLIMFQFSILRAPCFGRVKIPKYNKARVLSTLKGGRSTSPTATATGTASAATASMPSSGSDSHRGSKSSKSNSQS